jgi:hypothetical protein
VTVPCAARPCGITAVGSGHWQQSHLPTQDNIECFGLVGPGGRGGSPFDFASLVPEPDKWVVLNKYLFNE